MTHRHEHVRGVVRRQRALGHRQADAGLGAEGEPRPGRRHGAPQRVGGLGGWRGAGRGAAVECLHGPWADVTCNMSH